MFRWFEANLWRILYYQCVRNGDPKYVWSVVLSVSPENFWKLIFRLFLEFDPQVAELIPKENVNKVKIAFLLTLNGRAVRQVHRLLKSLYDKNHFYYIHVDEVIYFVIFIMRLVRLWFITVRTGTFFFHSLHSLTFFEHFSTNNYELTSCRSVQLLLSIAIQLFQW